MSSPRSIRPEEIRKPVVAGQFYSDDPDLLTSHIEGFLGAVEKEELPGEILALIAPHAGYMYSGQVAAYAYAQVKDAPFKTVVVIAPSHHVSFVGASVYERGGYQTPLGVIPVNSELTSAIITRSEKLNFYPQAHSMEHSLEVQLPFLQQVLKDFDLVPIVMGDQSLPTCQFLAEAIASSLGEEKVLIVASSDLSHYHPYERAVKLDGAILEAVNAFEPEKLYQALQSRESEACGGGPMVAAMLAAEKLGASGAKVLKYANSGDVTGDRGQVVGYMAAAVFGPGKPANEA
jgi:AmmeMemoRadiSam system protein B